MYRLLAITVLLIAGCSADDVFPTETAAGTTDADSAGTLADVAVDTTPTQDASAQLDQGATSDTAGTAVPDVAHADTAPADTGPSDGGSIGPADVAADVGTDAGPGLPCGCKPGDIWLHGSCVPTVKLGCAAVKTCKPGACPGSATGKEVCDGTAGTPACVTSSVLPVCVPGPSMGFAPGSLRLHPIASKVGDIIKLEIRGGNFYIGALFWSMTVGKETLGIVEEGGHCFIAGKWTPKDSGVYPVTAYYGTPEHSPGTVVGSLAGFISVQSGDPGIQPGYKCASTDKCAQADPWKCGCVSGRCACEMKK